MKKIVILLMASGISLSLAACGGSNTKNQTNNNVSLYKTGTYEAEASEYEASGYKSIVTVTVGADGKISGVNWDAVHKDSGQTKKELGDEYDMKRASAIGKEWFEQAKAVEDELIKTQDPAAIPLDAEGYADGVTGCTIHVNEFVSLAAKALEKAK